MAKRVNTRFLIVLTAVLGCLIAAAVVAKVTVFRKDPKVYEASGDAAFQDGDYKKAVEYYRFATVGSKNANGVLAKTGDAFNRLVAEDEVNLDNARSVWNQALANDPKFEPALQRLLDSYWEEMDVDALRVDYARMREVAARLAEVRPGDAAVLMKSHVAVVRPWLEGLAGVRRQDVDKSAEELAKLVGRMPGDADVRYYLARYWVQVAVEMRDRALREEFEAADKYVAQAAALFDQALADPPKEPAALAAMQLRAAQAYGLIQTVERAAAAEKQRRQSRDVIVANPAGDENADPGGFGAKADKAMAAAVAAARTLPAESPLYFEVQKTAAERASRQKRLADAEKIFEDLIAKCPEDQRARVMYARHLATTPGKREKAIEVLKQEVKVTQLTGPRGAQAQDLRIVTLMDLIGIKIDQARALAAAAQNPEATTSTAKQRQELVDEIQADMQKLEPMVRREAWEVLRLRARLLQLQGRPADAVETYQRAVNLMEGLPKERISYDLINELALAYIQAGQTGSAKKYLEKIIRQYDWFVPAKLQMAQILMNENKLDEAETQLKSAERQLVKLTPGSPDAAAVRAEFDRTSLAWMKLKGDTRLEQSYARLPENTRAEKLNKAAVARQVSKNDEAVRLTASAVKDDPKDLVALEAHLAALLSADRREEALAALDAAIAANPDKAARLKPARDQLAAAVELTSATPQQVYEKRKQLLMAQPESPGRALRLADLDREFGRLDEAEKALLALHTQNADDVQVTSRLFELNLGRKEWDKARGFMQKLAAANADQAGGLLYQYRLAMSQGNEGDRDARREALRLAKALVAARGDFDVAWIAYGQALQANGRHAEAVDQYTAALQRKAASPDALRGLIECYLAMGQSEPAQEALGQARTLFPNNPTFRKLELRYQLQYGDPMSAVAQREQLQRSRPEDPEAALDLAVAYREGAKTRPESAAAQRDELRRKAADLLNKAMAKWPGDSRFVSQAADLALESGDLAAGEKLLKEFIALPDQKGKLEGQVLLAEYYVRSPGRLDEAEAAYREALKLAAAQSAAQGAKGDSSAAGEVRIQLSGLLAQRRKFDESLKVLEEAAGGSGAALADADRRLFNQWLNVLIMAGRRHDAEEALVAALKKGDDPGLQMMLVRVNFDGGKYDEALDRVTRLLKADPENPEGHFFRGQILLRKPQPDLAGAVNELQLVKKADPRNVPTRVLLADAYRQQGDTPAAVRELEEGLRNDVTSRDLRLTLMDYRSGGAGMADLSAVLQLVREARAHPQLKDDPVWARREARVWTERRDWPKAIAAIEDALKLAPSDTTIVREQQAILLASENFKQVLQQTDRVVREGRAPWWVYMNRGAARNGLKDQAGALAEFNLALTAAGGDNAAVEQIVKQMTTTVGKDKALEQVMARADKDVRWKLLAAALHSVYKDWEPAVKLLDDVQAHFNELQPRQQAQALRIAGPLYQLARPPQLDKAKAAYLKLLELEPEDLFALNNLATLLVDESLVPQPQEAKVYSQKAYEKVKRAQPFPAAVWDTHGWVLVQCGGTDLDEGIGILQRVVRQTPLPDAHYHLAEAFMKKNEPKRALEELQEAARTINTNQIGIATSPDLDKKIQSATERAKEMQKAGGGAEAGAR